MSRSHVRTPGVLAAVLLAAAAPAQDDARAAAKALGEQATAEVVAAYHARADALAANKQFGRALQLRREIVQEWAPGDPKALKALGYFELGAQWRRDANIVVPDRDTKGDVKVQKKLDAEWAKAQKDLVKSVERAAHALAAAGADDEALVYWRRLLRLKPGDARALAATQLPTFDGLAGTPKELAAVRRGRALVQAVRFLDQMTVPATRVDDRNPVLDKAGVPYTCMQSEHFRVFGTLAEDKLQLALRNAERGLLLARAMFGAEGGEVFHPKVVRDFIWVGDQPTYARILDACADQFEKERLRFLKEDVELAFLDVGGTVQRLYVVTKGGDDLMVDVTARGVVQDAVGFHTDGMWEGLGHAAVAFLFDRTLSFFVEQQHGHTASSWQPKPLLPDMASWREIATESAWAKNDTPSGRLVLLEGYKLTNEERVKAWSIVDYLARTRPHLLLALDAAKTKDVKDQLAVEAAFLRATGVDLRTIDDEWREYWGKGEALRAAMVAQPAGATADVDMARPLSFAIDRARAAADVYPTGFVLADSADCRAVRDWIAAMQRFDKERKDPRKKDLAPPTPPLCLQTTVLLHRGTDVDQIVAEWLGQPVLRDWLLHPGRNLVAVAGGKDGYMLDLTTPATAVTRGWPDTWPRQGQRVRGSMRAGDLGPGVVEALAAAGIAADATVGMPLTLHFHRELSADERQEIQCRVRSAGERPGVLVSLHETGSIIAPGCFAFVPREPLPAGAATVDWTLPHGMIAKDHMFPRLEFTVE